MRFVSLLFRFSVLLMALVFSGALKAEQEALPALSQDGAKNEVSAETPAPLNYLPGKTTLQEAQDYWRENQMEVVSSGYLALGAGRGVDNMAEAYMRDAEIHDVRSPGLFDIPQVRFIFFKEVLYSVQVGLRSGMQDAFFIKSDADIEALKQKVIKKYGKPSKVQVSYLASGKKPDVSTWHLQGNDLVFVANKHEASFTYTNPALGKKLEAHKKVVCKEFNVNGRNFCW